jgi:hypothetical protein
MSSGGLRAANWNVPGVGSLRQEWTFRWYESTFVNLLKIDGFTIGSSRLTVWLQDTAGVFGGHAIEVRIEKGEITEICLAG